MQVWLQAEDGTHPGPDLQSSHLPMAWLHLDDFPWTHYSSQAALVSLQTSGSLAGSHGEHLPVVTSQAACGLPQVVSQKALLVQSGSVLSVHGSHFMVEVLHFLRTSPCEHGTMHSASDGY